VRSAVLRHPLLAYFGLAWGISWLAWLPRIASVQGWWARDVPEWWHYAGAAGPITAAVIVAALVGGRRGLAALANQYHPAGMRAGWVAFVVVSLGGLFALGAIAERLVEGAWPAYAELAKSNNLPALGLPLTFLVHTLTFGVGEETGWRAFALPRLQESRSAFRATALLFAGWAMWHVPSFFENESYGSMGPGEIVGWGVGLALGTLFLTWLYNSTSGSMLTLVLWHGIFNTIAASEAAPGLIAAVATTGIMVIAIVALLAAGPAELRGLGRRSGARVRWSDLEPPVSSTSEASAPAPGDVGPATKTGR
jgi:uncharacterized protein